MKLRLSYSLSIIKIIPLFILTFLLVVSCQDDDVIDKTDPVDNDHDTTGQTVGLFINQAEAYPGYTLFAPLASTTTYLIDNCGEKVHEWESEHRPGLSVYLLENGLLLRTANANNTTFDAGGRGGIIQLIDWDGQVIWEYIISSNTQCQHHDVEYLPNGNILAIVWESHTREEALQAGRIISGATVWSEKIIEITPDIVGGGTTLVWEWDAWDHLVQDQNSSADNYNIVADHPEKININFHPINPEGSDWLHINSVDYNAELDQIVLSNHNFSELWIIDHSTTTEEAATDLGGVSGKGGSLLYRWGNPAAYNAGDATDQKLFVQHDAKWLKAGATSLNQLMIFNNEAGTQNNSDYSSIDIISTPLTTNGLYELEPNAAYAPLNTDWTYTSSPSENFYAENISGATQLPNGNVLICEGPTGRFFEVTQQGNIVWQYINPVQGSVITSQFEEPNGNRVFRAEKYPIDYPAFEGKDLNPQGYIEEGSTFSCTILNN